MILSVVKGSRVSSQDELKEKLSAAGLEVTQATLSRDLRALGVIRVFHPEDGYCYACAQNDAPHPASSQGVTEDGRNAEGGSESPDRETLFRDIKDILFSGNLAVIKTRMGYATGVAMGIDKLELPDVVGTVGGDDTLLVVLKEDCDRQTFLRELRG